MLDGQSMDTYEGQELSKHLSVVLTERIHPEMMTCREVVATGRYPYTGKFGVLTESDKSIVEESMELARVQGIPRVFVIAGNGSATSVYRRLQRDNIPFVTGILWENDLDYPSAMALAEETISTAPFEPISKEAVLRAKKWIDKCNKVIYTLNIESLGEYAEGLREILAYAKKEGKI